MKDHIHPLEVAECEHMCGDPRPQNSRNFCRIESQSAFWTCFVSRIFFLENNHQRTNPEKFSGVNLQLERTRHMPIRACGATSCGGNRSSGSLLPRSEWLDHAERASTSSRVASGGPIWGYGYHGLGDCLGDGQTEAEGVPSQGWYSNALLRRMPSYLNWPDLNCVTVMHHGGRIEPFHMPNDCRRFGSDFRNYTTKAFASLLTGHHCQTFADLAIIDFINSSAAENPTSTSRWETLFSVSAMSMPIKATKEKQELRACDRILGAFLDDTRHANCFEDATPSSP